MMWRIFLVLLCLFPGNVFGQSAPTAVQDEVWYKMVGGIIGIPTGILGLLVSWVLVKKMLVEIKKLELDIAEKQKALLVEPSQTQKIEMLVEPLGHNQLALLILVRFVLLYLTLGLWNIVPAAITFLASALGGIAYGAIWLLGATGALDSWFEGSNWLAMSAVMLPTVLRTFTSVFYWALLLGFGWPLLKDTCAFLNIPMKSLFDLPILWRRRRGKPDM